MKFFDIDNPFVECEPELVNIMTKIAVNEYASESVRKTYKIWETSWMYKIRFHFCLKSIKEPS